MNKKGFTLVEMIGVLIIMGILASIVTVQFSQIIKENRKKLNEEQKSRIVETAKNITLNNKSCLTKASNEEKGVKITLDQMKKFGYISNKDLKNLEDNTILNSCVVVKWDASYSKFLYEYNDTCPEVESCIIGSESEKVVVSSFKLKDSNNKVNFTNKSSVKYYLNYTSSINAEYCVTLGNEASCTWQKLSMTKNSAEGNINLVSGVNIAHLFIRNANRNIIATINDTINYDIEAPSCNWLSPTKTALNNNSIAEITLNCSDISGISNLELSANQIKISNNLISLSDAIVTENGNNKQFKFVITGLDGNGDVYLEIDSFITDNSGNMLNSSVRSSTIKIDNIKPTGTVTLSGDIKDNLYTNNSHVTLKVKVDTDAGSPVESVCISNIENNCTNYRKLQETYDWVLSSGDGDKNVYVTFKDMAGNTNQVTVSIKLDQIKPYCLVKPVINKQALNKDSYVDYTINCADVMAIGEYHITTSDLALTSDLATAEVIEDTGNGAVIRVKAQAGDGKVTVYLNPNVISDKAGNYNDRITIADSLIIDNTPPINNSITINYRANITERNIIVVSLSSDLDRGYYCLSLEKSSTNCNWIDYSRLTSYTLPNKKGNYTVYAYFKDLAGNVSVSGVSDTINYDPDAITCYITVNNDQLLINSQFKSLNSLPYSWDGENWSLNNQSPITTSNFYRAYIKDINNNINYCEYSKAS